MYIQCNIICCYRCLIDNKWFKQWKKYVGYDSWETSNVGDRATHPGPIDNSPLLRGNINLCLLFQR